MAGKEGIVGEEGARVCSPTFLSLPLHMNYGLYATNSEAVDDGHTHRPINRNIKKTKAKNKLPEIQPLS